jgi:cell division protease FtsH
MVIREQDRRLTAWHEAGHAIARLTLFPDSKLDYLSIVPNEAGALGFAAWQPDESKHTYSAQDYRNLIIVALAGREAEKLCPGAGEDAVNTGVSSDYERATALAWDAVSRFGFDDEFGVLSLPGTPQNLQPDLANTTRSRVQVLLAACLSSTHQLMFDQQPKLSSLATMLLDKEALYGEEVM